LVLLLNVLFFSGNTFLSIHVKRYFSKKTSTVRSFNILKVRNDDCLCFVQFSTKAYLLFFLPASNHRKVTLKDPESEPPLRMNGVVFELSKFDLLLTNARIVGRTIRMLMHSVPEAKVRSSCSVIVSDDVVRVGDPVSGWRNTHADESEQLQSVRVAYRANACSASFSAFESC